jgi:hypothetical protein
MNFQIVDHVVINLSFKQYTWRWPNVVEICGNKHLQYEHIWDNVNKTGLFLKLVAGG